MDFVCTPDETLALGAIAGVLTVEEYEKHKRENVPLIGAEITLIDNTDNVVYTTYTVDDGAFVFYDVPDGKYTLLSATNGYLRCSFC